MSSRPIVVLGSANMDLVVRVARHPCPGETVAGHALALVPGGKGANQAIAAARAGGDVALLGAVGDDDHGRAVRTTLTDAGVDVDGLGTVDTATGTAHVVVDDAGENTIVVVPGANGTVRTLADDQAGIVDDAAWLVVQLELPLEVVTGALVRARRAGSRTVLTPAPARPLDDDVLGHVDVLVANEHEAAVLAGVDDVAAAAAHLRARGPEVVVVTLGAAGCLVLDDDGARRHPAPVVDVVDTTAAGDTFVGCLVAARHGGATTDDAIEVATTGAALSVQRAGASTSMPTRAEIDAARTGG